MEARLLVLKLVLEQLGVNSTIETLTDRIRVQKAVYLAQLSGVDLGYRFGWYVHGPYSPQLTKDYFALASSNAEASSGALRPDLVTKLEDVKGLFSVPNGVDLLDHEWIELVASVDYLQRVSGLAQEAARERIQDAKPSKSAFYDKAVAALESAHLVSSV